MPAVKGMARKNCDRCFGSGHQFVKGEVFRVVDRKTGEEKVVDLSSCSAHILCSCVSQEGVNAFWSCFKKPVPQKTKWKKV